MRYAQGGGLTPERQAFREQLRQRRKLANTAFADPDHLVQAVRSSLREIQYRPQLIEGVLTETGLALRPEAS